MQSSGQTSTQTWQRVQDQISIEYSLFFFIIEFSGQTR